MKTKKEIKQEYKEIKFKIGVFQIRNSVNEKIYIESSNDLIAIWKRHRFQLNCGNHPNAELQKDWKEFGEDKFKFEIVSEIKQSDTENADNRKELKLLEEMYLEELNPFEERGYNKKRK
nr:GIY-YIG nuclease family protein [uncultured Flavobacterium sp.]